MPKTVKDLLRGARSEFVGKYFEMFAFFYQLDLPLCWNRSHPFRSQGGFFREQIKSESKPQRNTQHNLESSHINHTMMSTAVSTKAGVSSAASTRKVVVARRILGAASSRTASVAGLRSKINSNSRSVKVFAGDDLKNTAQDLLTTATEKWEETEDKPTVVTLAFAGLITLIVTSSLLGSLDKVPFLGSILELVGIGYTAYFAYNNLLFTPDREALMKKVDETKEKIL